MADKLKRRRSSHVQVQITKVQVFWKRFVRSFKMSIRFIFSHIGLTGSVVAYSILGGWIFMELEAPHEQELRNQIATIRDQYVKLILNASEMSSCDDDDRYLVNVTYQYIVEFEEKIVQFIDDTGWNGFGEEKELQWSYAGALLYSVTVITTIGYGHIAPKTTWGRIVTIIYAVFGIPLTLLCLRTIGSLMAGTFKFIYCHICYRLYLRWQQFQHYIAIQRHEHGLRLRQAKHALEELIEKGNEMWRSTEMLLMNGNKQEAADEEDFSSTSKASKALQIREIARDRSHARRLRTQRTKRNSKRLEMSRSEIMTSSNGKITTAADDVDIEKAPDTEGQSRGHKSNTQTENKIKSENVKSHQKDLNNEISSRVPEVRVPVSISLLIIAAYVFLGAVLFSLWEKNWDYLISSYFCFVTLSTIGFGDFVPGSDVESWASAEKQAICTLYLLFGMAMIAMCFNLMQQEVILKFTDLGRRMGLIEDKQISILEEGEEASIE